MVDASHYKLLLRSFERDNEIEAAQRRTLQFYHVSASVDPQRSWCLRKVSDPYIAPRLESLYYDRAQAYRQRFAIMDAWRLLPDSEYLNNGTVIETKNTSIDAAYERALTLYLGRLQVIHDEAIKWLNIWSDWAAERSRPLSHRNDMLIAACESTLSFLEQDYVNRKLDFTTEVYAVLEKQDPKLAKVLLKDLRDMWPWLDEDFTRRLEQGEIDYRKLRNKLPQV